MLYPGKRCVLEKNVYFAAIRWDFFLCLLDTIRLQYCFSSIFLLNFALVDLYIIESGLLKSLPLLCYYFSLQFCQCLFHVFDCPVARCIYIYSYISLVNWLSYHYITSFCVSCDAFWLRVYVCDISLTTLLFWLPFSWNTFFHPFTFSLCLSLYLM